jgi:DNA polymerase III delta subunit
MIYFYHGENGFATQRQTESDAAKFIEQHGAEAVTRLDASEMEPQALIAEIVNINMFTPQRLVIIRGLETMRTTWGKIGENLTRIPDGTDLIIANTKPDKRTKTYKDLLKSAKTHEFPILQGQPLRRWLVDEALRMRVKIDAEAVDELLIITGGDGDQQARLAAEIAKFRVLGRSVNVDLVRQIVEPNLATNAFEVLSLAIVGKRQEVAAELKNLCESGEDANKFFGLLTSQVFALAAAVFAGSEPVVAGELKIHPFQLARMRDLAKQLGDAVAKKRRVKQITKILADADAKMKLSRANEAWILVETAFAKIISS